MMEIKEKHRIIWKNGFEKNDKKTHLNRYLFLLELFKNTVKQKDFINYDTYRDITEYFDFPKNEIFESADYDKSFLTSDKKDKQHEKELIRNYRKNIHHPKKQLSSEIWILNFLGVLALLYGGLHFLPLRNELIRITSFYSLIVAISFLMCSAVFWLYLKGNFDFTHLTKELFMRPVAFIENLEYEKRVIEDFIENYSELNQLKGFKCFCTHLPEARIYFEVLIDNDYIEIKNNQIKYNSPCTQKVFAEILKDPVFVFSSKLSAIPKDVFEGLFGKSLNKMEQREQKTSESNNFKEVKEFLINSKVPIHEEYL